MSEHLLQQTRFGYHPQDDLALGAITATNRDVMVPIVAAMSRVENGKDAVMADVEAGWKLFMQNR